jgi:hypothetical protein
VSDLQHQIYNVKSLNNRKKQAALLSLVSAPVVLFWGEAKQDSSGVRIAAWFQCHKRKPTSFQ